MAKKRKSKIELRYYKMPAGIPILALLGQKWVRSYGEGIDYLHFHNCMEIGYCYEGKGIMTIGEKDYRFSGEQFTVIPHNCPHTTTSDVGTMSRWEYLFLDVDEVLQGVWSDSNEKKMGQVIRRINARGVFGEAEKLPELAGKIRQVLDIMRETKEFYAEEAKGVLAAFLVALARENQDETQDTEDQKVNDLITDALNYVSRHYMEPIRIETLAGRCHISETHFRRLFSSCMNMGPLEYINLVRIQNACELLRKTDVLVSEIAFRCGFSTLSTFNRNFKQIVGCSPFEWRKKPENFEQQLLKYEVHSEEGW